jgi:hypothetical protein
MKTPREILLHKHANMELQLSERRRTVVEELTKEQQMQTFSVMGFLLSLRWHLAGATVVWILAMWLNSDGNSPAAPTIASQKAVPAIQVLAALQEHRRQLLNGGGDGASAAEPIIKPASRSRSEIQRSETIQVV